MLCAKTAVVIALIRCGTSGLAREQVLDIDSPNLARIDVSQLPSGVYFLRVLSRDGSYYIAPFVKL